MRQGLRPAFADTKNESGFRDKFGIYTSAETTSCQRDLQSDGQRLPAGSRGYERADARSFAEMGAYFVKVDWCGRYETRDSRSSYETWRDALAATGRPMVHGSAMFVLTRLTPTPSVPPPV